MFVNLAPDNLRQAVLNPLYLLTGSSPGVQLKPNVIELLFEACGILWREMLLHEIFVGNLMLANIQLLQITIQYTILQKL